MPKPSFQKGNKYGKGGKRPGSGRNPSWFKDLCREELQKNKADAIRKIGLISRGELPVEKLFCSEGGVITAVTKPSPGDMISATEFLRDSSEGKPTQAVEVTGDAVVNLIDAIKAARSQRGLKE